jgi:biotin operon repressor
MTINLDHTRGTVGIGTTGNDPDAITGTGLIYAKTADGGLYYQDGVGNESSLSLAPVVESLRRGYDLADLKTPMNPVSTQTTELQHLDEFGDPHQAQFSITHGMYHDVTNNQIYVVGKRSRKEEVPDPEFREAAATGWTLTNNSTLPLIASKLQMAEHLVSRLIQMLRHRGLMMLHTDAVGLHMMPLLQLLEVPRYMAKLLQVLIQRRLLQPLQHLFFQ